MGWLDGNTYGRYLACANPHSLEVARRDELFHRALRSADLLIPDGVGIVLASRINGGNIRQRVTGSDIFHAVNTALNERKGASVFFLGSTPGTLAKIRDRLARDYPAVRVAGVLSPTFRQAFSESETGEMLEAVNAAKPDALWVGMTAPKQEKWIYQNRSRLQARFIGAIGAVFDFYTGNVKRSHPLFQRMGLEWLPRLLQEPRRLWRRNFVSNPSFLLRVIRKRIF
jgi:N-acetylglucosaminyldiphosphoundecaprenol N-acetyl-beta-D-mannosaminyltransferase